jgi:putative transposase
MKRRVKREPDPVVEVCPIQRIMEALAGDLHAHCRYTQRGKSTESRINLLLKGKRRFTVDPSQWYHWMKESSSRMKDLQAQYPDHSIIADITYIRLRKRFAYVAIVMDLHSGTIIGFDLSMSLAAEGCIRALKMAIERIAEDRRIIHYSDRGIQYRCREYVQIIEEERNGTMRITANGNIYEQAIAERINDVLGTEFSLNRDFDNLKQARKFIAAAIRLYNGNRRQKSIGIKSQWDNFSENEQAA